MSPRGPRSHLSDVDTWEILLSPNFCGRVRPSLLWLPCSYLQAQTVKHLSTMRGTRVRSLGREDPLEKEMAIHFSTIAWKIPWTEKPGRLQSMGSQRVGHDWATSHAHMQRYEKVISPPENHHPTNPGNLIISLTPLTPQPLNILITFL